jgi:hypothetical protein
MKNLIFLPVFIFFLACSSTKKTTTLKVEEQSLPELPLSELDIPIKIAAAPILEKAEKWIPARARWASLAGMTTQNRTAHVPRSAANLPARRPETKAHAR